MNYEKQFQKQLLRKAVSKTTFTKRRSKNNFYEKQF